MRTAEEQEIYELTRDARTVFVSQLVVRAGERDVRAFFNQIGPVADVRLIKDKQSNRSKGLGYVEFEDLDSVPKALLLNGQAFCMKHAACSCSGFPIAIKASECEKNYAALAEAAGGSSNPQTLEKRCYIGDLPSAVTEGDLKTLAGMVGTVDKVAIIRDDRGHSRGVAYVQFVDSGSAGRAASSLHGLELGGARIRVGRLTAMGDVVCADGTTFSFDKSSGAGLTAHARAALMTQLSSATNQAAQQLGSTLMAVAAAAGTHQQMQQLQQQQMLEAGQQAAAAAPLLQEQLVTGLPSPCLTLRNMFDPATETEPGWDKDIAEEVREEAVKYGQVAHVYADPSSAGCVHVAFGGAATGAALPSAISFAAAQAGRKFNGLAIKAEFVPVADYIARFPDAAAAL